MSMTLPDLSIDRRVLEEQQQVLEMLIERSVANTPVTLGEYDLWLVRGLRKLVLDILRDEP